VTVCTGNVCRSPLAAALINYWAARADVGGSAKATSGGTRPALGCSMHPEAVALARAHGADAPAHAAHALVLADIRSADLILTAERAHRAAVARLLPRAAPKIYTIREFAALAAALSESPTAADPTAAETQHGPDRLGAPGRESEPLDDPVAGALAALEAISRRRGLGPRRKVTDDDIVDPILGGKAAFRTMESQLIPALRTGFDVLFAPTGRRCPAPTSESRD
jgi:protein-tyrosine phosphatase